MSKGKTPKKSNITFNSDGTASEDLLGRKKFAEQIADSLVNTFDNDFESIVFGLNGKWGSGKSTLLDFIRIEIKKHQKENQNENFIIYNFNPWMFSGQDELQRMFFQELFLEIGDFNEELRGIFEKMGNLIGKLGFVKYLHSGLGRFQEDFGKYMEELGKEQSLVKLKENLNKVLVEKRIKLYVFIDDIDRLKPDEVLEVFQLVKLNANFNNVIYLLSYDREVVENAISNQNYTNASNYLEKIIQVDYTLPEILEEKIEEIFFSQMDLFFNKYKIPFEANRLLYVWHYNGLKAYFSNLRHVYRFLNALHFRLPAIYKEVNILEFLLLEAIRVFDYQGYAKIYEDFSKETKGMHAVGYTKKTEMETDRFQNKTTIKLVKILSGPRKPSLSHLYSKRLFDNNYFERYFALMPSSKDVSETEFENFINDKSRRKETLGHIYKNNRFPNFLRKICSPSFKEQFKIDDFDIVYDLFNFIDDNNDEIKFKNCQPLIIQTFTNLLASFRDDPYLAKERFVDFLHRDTGRFSNARIYFLWFFIIYPQKEEIEYPLHDIEPFASLISQQIEEITRIFKKLLDDGKRKYIRLPSKIKNEKMYFIVFQGMFKFHSETLHDLLGEVYKSPNEVAAMCKIFTLRDADGSCENILGDYFVNVFSKQDYDAFLNAINECDLALISTKNSIYVEYFRENMAELKRFSENLELKNYKGKDKSRTMQ